MVIILFVLIVYASVFAVVLLFGEMFDDRSKEE